MVRLRDGLPDRLEDHRLPAGVEGSGQVTRDRRLARVGPQRLSDRREGLGSCEELVHDLGAGGDHRPQFPAVGDFGGVGGGVSDQPGDLLDADPAVAHQADE